MKKILVDTSILIAAQHDKVLQYELQRHEKRLLLSRVTAYELIQGSGTKKQKKENLELLRHLPIVEINETISKKAFQLLCVKIPQRALSIPDALIAVTAMEHRCLLWTKNTKDFIGISGITLYQNQQ